MSKNKTHDLPHSWKKPVLPTLTIPHLTGTFTPYGQFFYRYSHHLLPYLFLIFFKTTFSDFPWPSSPSSHFKLQYPFYIFYSYYLTILFNTIISRVQTWWSMWSLDQQYWLSAESLIEMQNLRPQWDPLSQHLQLTNSPGNWHHNKC